MNTLLTDKKNINRQGNRRKECGNALIYVLIAIALFAALNLTLSRQTDTNEANSISDDLAELLSTQLISYAAQAKSVADQMIFTGSASTIDDMDFILPTNAGFNAGTKSDLIKRVYHPEGGGLNPAKLPEKAIYQIASSPIAGWYIGRFNNVEWTKTSAQDVILVAYQIDKTVCEKINEKITGSTTIPALADIMSRLLIDNALHGSGNLDLTTAKCAGCDTYFSLCVSNSAVSAWSFYSIIGAQ